MRGYWMCTYTGKRFHCADPRREEICLEDIAQGLAHQVRFAGQTFKPYTIAQHCVHVSERAEALGRLLNGDTADVDPIHLARWGLIHDAPEAYLMDLPRPVKRTVGYAYQQMEDNLMRLIADMCGLYPLARGTLPPLVVRADDELLATERESLFRLEALEASKDWGLPIGPVPGLTIDPWPHDVARCAFINRWNVLGLPALE